ncbi:unnamed protein product [Durusdinium trenchii]|uniref:Uncharacterized protein n=1 Tax=Durusdinium trenchii TaxID=1381693 RepID=A0ABP0MCI6_9DINO
MEIAAILQHRSLELDLEWAPRLQNVHADSLTNAVYRGFNPVLRIRFCLDDSEGIVLQKMFKAGAEPYSFWWRLAWHSCGANAVGVQKLTGQGIIWICTSRIGINQKHARWLHCWCQNALQEKVVKLADMQSVLGRMRFAFAALEHLRPFLGPIYKWVAALKHVQECRWYSDMLNRQNAFWAFLAGELFCAIATLEMLATLAALVVFENDAEGRSASTGNLGNACVLRRW